MKSIWKGYIAFGLVNIPIKLYSAVEAKKTDFKLVHKSCKTPIHYKRWCSYHDMEVQWEDIEKGIEIGKDDYFLITKEEIEKLKPEKSDFMEVIEFIDSDQIDSIYFEKHYFAAPESNKEKAYFLFKEILQATAKVAIGKIVMRENEYVCMIKSYKRGLLLTTLNYSYQIRDIDEIEELKDEVKLQKNEIELANELINKLYKEDFDIVQFKDTFSEKLKVKIKERLEGKEVILDKPKVEEEKQTLIEALKASIER